MPMSLPIRQNGETEPRTMKVVTAAAVLHLSNLIVVMILLDSQVFLPILAMFMVLSIISQLIFYHQSSNSFHFDRPNQHVTDPLFRTFKVLDAAWRSAEAYHFLILVMNQLHEGNVTIYIYIYILRFFNNKLVDCCCLL